MAELVSLQIIYLYSKSLLVILLTLSKTEVIETCLS